MLKEPRRRRPGKPYEPEVPIWFSLGVPILILVLAVMLVIVLVKQP